ncbi:hypothetical protein WAJ35_24720, partial [Acinetobacter baumannii]
MHARRFRNENYKHLAHVDHQFKTEVKDDSTDITIYGDIGESWWSESTSALDIERALKNVSSNEINIHLNSPGGDVFDGIA